MAQTMADLRQPTVPLMSGLHHCPDDACAVEIKRLRERREKQAAWVIETLLAERAELWRRLKAR